MKGLVLKSTGSWYTVALEDGREMLCRIKGKFRMEGKGFTNPIAVGDKVLVEEETAGEGGVINEILPRDNYLVRASPRKKHGQHILAANLNQAVLIITLRQPKLKRGFIDRFLVGCEAYHVPAVLLCNKKDLWKEEDRETWELLQYTYKPLGYKLLAVSAETGEGLDDLNRLVKDKVSLMAGHSGVGKSTVIMRLNPDLDLKIAPLSGYSGKGQHTTTFANMHPLPEGGYIIDTPGIKELSVVDIEAEELAHYFPEMRDRMEHCRFNNCLHLDEPGCAVLEALEAGEIDPIRYENYFYILTEIREQKPW
jgi:ribosome biogenesis GTPase